MYNVLCFLKQKKKKNVQNLKHFQITNINSLIEI